MILFPFFWIFRKAPKILIGLAFLQMGATFYLEHQGITNPARSVTLLQQRNALRLASEEFIPDWQFELAYMTRYEQLNLLLRYETMKAQHHRWARYCGNNELCSLPSLWALEQQNYEAQIIALHKQIDLLQSHYIKVLSSPSHEDLSVAKQYRYLMASLSFLEQRHAWLEEQSKVLRIYLPAWIRPFHWQEDAGGSQQFNHDLPWWELTRKNRKDLLASLLFGIRVSILVGILTTTIALLVGIPIGACAGYFGGRWDLYLCRLIEIWEAMPTFFMLLLIIAFTESKSILMVTTVLGLFSWPPFSRFMRAEVLKQKHLPYVQACKMMSFSTFRIIFWHILPNAIPPILTLIPFTMMSAIASEAGLSFLGLGEEGGTSWGILMDEGRSSFPAESFLLWPPAIVLSLLLISIAVIGDSLRDALDPKFRR